MPIAAILSSKVAGEIELVKQVSAILPTEPLQVLSITPGIRFALTADLIATFTWHNDYGTPALLS
jgi:hypothetical protein